MKVSAAEYAKIIGKSIAKARSVLEAKVQDGTARRVHGWKNIPKARSWAMWRGAPRVKTVHYVLDEAENQQVADHIDIHA